MLPSLYVIDMRFRGISLTFPGVVKPELKDDGQISSLYVQDNLNIVNLNYLKILIFKNFACNFS
ncbi:hypothetical protein EEX84_09055 [Planococcus salinus]|uniref:Uncharacterized protein n=1 Tax=Planococcus salinus TaxID=1848460 RepID=A0A3M8P7E3_9BACL|nr:hypothetical protein EEX84_09055 [Planococcus salinus]